MPPRFRERLSVIEEGNAGVFQTAWAMARSIRSESSSCASLVTRWSHDQSGDALLDTLIYWVRGHMLYTFDPPTRERYLTPDAHMATIQMHGQSLGDCDDFVVLLGGFLWQARIPQRLVLVSLTPDRELTHVYTRVLTGAGWQPVDATQPWPVGIEVDADRRTLMIDVAV